MSLFGSSPPDDSAALNSAKIANSSRSTLFDNEAPTTRSGSALFADDDDDSPWDMPTPRKQRSRADLIRNLLPSGDVPESYIETFDAVARTENSGSTNGRITAGGVARTLAAAKLGADDQARIMGIIAPTGAGGSGGDGANGEEANSSAAGLDLGRNEFNVLLALIGLVQEGEVASLDGVDERRRKLPQPKLQGLVENVQPVLPDLSELAAKPPQRPVTPPKAPTPSPPKQQQQQHQPRTLRKVSMEYPEDPWNAPDLHKGHNHGPLEHSTGHNGAADVPRSIGPDLNGNGAVSYSTSPEVTTTSAALPGRTTSTFTTSQPPSGPSSIHNVAESIQESNGAWNYFPGNSSVGGFSEPADNAITSPFGGNGGPGQSVGGPVGGSNPNRSIGHVRSGSNVEENILVTLMPEKEGMFMFQHHNYEVSSIRRGSKVVRRYSDFVWLLDCLHKRYPFRVLPLLPPKRVAQTVNGNHLSNDGAFIEKRRRGLARFLNALVRHPVLGQEQLVIMFLTVPTELSVWRKQATISVQDEFTGRTLPPGLEDSLPPTLEELFARARAGVRRSAELYISTCTIMDRLVKRSEGVAADHARMALSLISLTEASADTYATDNNDVPLLNDGLQAMGRHLRTAQTLMEDEAKAWEEGVLEDLKRQRDALVSLRDLFDRRERLDKDNIPFLQRRIETNEAKLQALNAKPEGMVKPGEKERVVEAIIKDKESIVTQHNRSVFVKECIRDELRFFQGTQYNVSRLTQDWAQERVKYSEMLADNWRRLLDDLEGMPLGD
ncbi:sorting nexin mvp-1 [Neurospora tetraspora]|uniref:Sorting nexin MVP1 n=1 Tax=Neurospora tetraspora TaxID=94610 RepID=A0AAE0IZX2_9PEZI|nr:sorting nexin mvp-1 [Neurospora tetraspora]